MKIDLTDKFIHSPNWEYTKDLERFQDIVKNGYLVTPEESGIRTSYYKDKIFLAVHPNGIYSNDYPASGMGIFTNLNGYTMATHGLYFILNSKVKEDYDLQPLTYKYECFSNRKIDLYKYLEGIGNTGFNIDDKLIYCYYFIKFANDCIPASKIIEIVQERNLDFGLALAIKNESVCVNSLAVPEKNYLNLILNSKVEDLFKIGNYYEIVKILKEEKQNIKLYDKYGYLLDPEKRIDEVNNMYEYVISNKDIQMDDNYFNKIKVLCDSIKK